MNIFCFGDVIGEEQVWGLSINLQSNKVIVTEQFFLFILYCAGCCGAAQENGNENQV
jgi:hypothetical protein